MTLSLTTVIRRVVKVLVDHVNGVRIETSYSALGSWPSACKIRKLARYGLAQNYRAQPFFVDHYDPPAGTVQPFASIKSKYGRCSLIGESPGRRKMEPSKDGTEKTDYLFVSGADRSYAGKVRAHVLRGYMSHRRRHAKTLKSAGSTPKSLGESAERLDAGTSASPPTSKFVTFALCGADEYLSDRHLRALASVPSPNTYYASWSGSGRPLSDPG